MHIEGEWLEADGPGSFALSSHAYLPEVRHPDGSQRAWSLGELLRLDRIGLHTGRSAKRRPSRDA